MIYSLITLLILCMCVCIYKHNTIQEITPVGVCLFDLDGTLSSQNVHDNEKLIDVCINNGFIVGVCTSGPVYRPENLLTKFGSWFPKNLYEYMKKRDFDTFNNIGGQNKILMGVENEHRYDELLKENPEITFTHGFLKGFSLFYTSTNLGISDPKNMVLFDNDVHFIKGVKEYNPNLSAIVCNTNSFNRLDDKLIKQVIKSISGFVI